MIKSFEKHYIEIKSDIDTLLNKTYSLLNKINADEKDITLISDAQKQLNELFLIVIAGEYNAGKSAFINALLGKDLLKTGITPTTDVITILHPSDEESDIRLENGVRSIGIKAKILEELRIVDTPGTNAILRKHEILTKQFIPRSDIVIFITSVDRPFTESERAFLEKIKDWRKKIVFIINKTDLVEDEKDLRLVLDYVKDNAYKLLDHHPEIFMLSAKNALRFRNEEKVDHQMMEVERYITETLTERDRIRIKMSSPVDISETIASKYGKINDQNLMQIHQDRKLINDIENQLGLFSEDSLRRFKFRYADLDNAILEFQKRGIEFFDETFRINRLLDLVNKERTQREYKDKVLGNLSIEIDNKVHDLIEWLVDENFHQWQIVNEKIANRMKDLSNRIITKTRTNTIQVERKKIIDNVKRGSQRVIEKFDRNVEAENIARDAQMSVAASAAVEVGAIGLGTLVTILATTASADLTGILLAGITAALGFFIIPTKRTQAKNTFNNKVEALRTQLSQSLSDEISRQLDIVVDNIKSTIEPYERFVTAESKILDEQKNIISSISVEIEKIRSKIEKI